MISSGTLLPVVELVLILSTTSDGSGLVVGRNRIVGPFFGFFFFP